jgi:hypothetical protein
MSQPVTTAMDSLTAALKSNIIPNQEYLLQGSVLDSAVEVLLHRLRGLCDNVDSGPETFYDHEMCFSIRTYICTRPFRQKGMLHIIPSEQNSCDEAHNGLVDAWSLYYLVILKLRYRQVFILSPIFLPCTLSIGRIHILECVSALILSQTHGSDGSM